MPSAAVYSEASGLKSQRGARAPAVRLPIQYREPAGMDKTRGVSRTELVANPVIVAPGDVPDRRTVIARPQPSAHRTPVGCGGGDGNCWTRSWP
jgi:hypothetical protein